MSDAAELSPGRTLWEALGDIPDRRGAKGRRYPLLLERLRPLAPWPVTWLDPAPAIARRVVQLLGEPARSPADESEALAVFTGGSGLTPPLYEALAARGLPRIEIEALPLATQGDSKKGYSGVTRLRC